MENDQQNEVVNTNSKPNYVLPASILIAAVLISGSVIYAFGQDGGGGSGTAKIPNNAFTQCMRSNKYASLIQEDKTNADAVGVSGTPATFVNGQLVSGAQPWPVFKEVIDAALSGKVAVKNAQKGIGDVNPDVKITDRDVILGDANAPVTVIEYGDYQCPFCARFYKDTESLLRDQYIKQGKVKMVFRNYAFLGPESVEAAEAAECAKDQGQFWAYHDKLYEAEYADGREHNNNLNEELFSSIAQELKLNAKK